MNRAALLVAPILALVMACSTNPRPTPQPPPAPPASPMPPSPPAPPGPPSPTLGQLQIAVNGLSSDRTASVAVKFPDGSSRALTASTSLTDLQPGAYAINAKAVTGLYTFEPRPLEQAVTVMAAQTANATVSYVPVTGAIRFQFSGLLSGQKPQVNAFGPSGTFFSVVEEKTQPDLKPGEYFFNIVQIFPQCFFVSTNACFDYIFDTPIPITLKPGETAQTSVVFLPVSGSLDVTIVGLASGANARISIEGITVPKSGIVNHLRTDKLSLITAEDVAFDDFNYKPESRSSGVAVKRGEVIPVTFRYIPLDGKWRVAVSNPPPDPFKPLRVKGPAGFDGGAFNASTTFAHLESGGYTLTAQSVTVAPGKPGCKVYAPSVMAQSASVVAGQSVTASVAYTVEPCE